MQRRGAVSNEGEVEALLQLRTVQIPGELNGAAGIYQIRPPTPFSMCTAWWAMFIIRILECCVVHKELGEGVRVFPHRFE